MAENNTPTKTTNTRRGKKAHRESFSTHDGHALTPKEAKFIDEYIATGNARQSVIKAGYKSNTPSQYADKLLNKDYITSEINYRLEMARDESIADATEIMQYFTSVMRGEVADQFGLEASLAERTKAAQELAKRQIDIPNKLKGNDEPTLTIKLDWGQDIEPAGSSTAPTITLDGLDD